MEQIFLDVIENYNKKLGQSVGLHTKVLGWSVDYEKAWYLIYDEIPSEVQYFWINRLGTYLYKFEKVGHKWKMVEKANSISERDWKRINIGPAFAEVPQILHSHEITEWF